MIRKEVLAALGVLGGAALLTIGVPSYAEGTQGYERIPPMHLTADEQAHQVPIASQEDAANAEHDADTLSGVAGRIADDMTDEGPAGPARSLEEEDRP